jgi:hypothetical protein
MKHLLCGIAVTAALVIAAPVWAQPANPAGGTGGAPAPAPEENSATPPIHPHHAIRHAHAMHAHHMYMARKAALTGDTTAQLNREELARIQSGAPPAPMPAAPVPGAPMAAPENSSGGAPPH